MMVIFGLRNIRDEIQYTKIKLLRFVYLSEGRVLRYQLIMDL